MAGPTAIFESLGGLTVQYLIDPPCLSRFTYKPAYQKSWVMKQIMSRLRHALNKESLSETTLTESILLFCVLA